MNAPDQSTPLPWRVHISHRNLRRWPHDMSDADTGIEILSDLHGGYQTVVGHVNCQPWIRILSKENAEFICRAVNCHQDLVTVLCEIYADTTLRQDIREKAFAAIAKTEPKAEGRVG